MAYRITYVGLADVTRTRLPKDRRQALDEAMSRTIGHDPYGHGSNAPKKGERDYRQAVVADMLVVYYVSASVLTVTAVKLINL
ncbi:hypothetical protein [Streptomyces sp. MP131-18]|uniref:hypothetical protein n=1 Tax=Streptomyces sp. MP131-18 TaxID=1857892 RepID=UPI00097C240F|nr:hypothetical protein [Streptomyces sp. MP131-18]ONK09294.1 hypothetical protein STBA_71490 [Streptomyces sp. MP131-18]